jgi:ATP-binding cassette, subfamily B, bacterial
MSDRTALATVRRGLALTPELRLGLGGTLLLAFVATVGRVIVPIALQQVFDRGLTPGGVDMGFVGSMTLVSLAAVVVTGLTTSWMYVRLARVSETALSGLRVRAFRHIHDLSMLHQASEQRGSLVARVTSDVDEISRFVQRAGITLITNGGQALLALIVMLVYSVQLGAVVLVLIPVIMAVIRWFQRRLDVAFLAVRKKVGRMLGVLAEAVVGGPVIRAYGAEHRTRQRLGAAIEEHRSTAVRAGLISSLFSGAGELLAALVIAAVLVVGVVLAANGTVTVGVVVSFMLLAQLFVQPVQTLGEAVNEAQTAVAGWRRVLDILDVVPDVADPGPDGVDLPDRALDVEFADVSFVYPTASEHEGAPALNHVSVHLLAESKVAVVGETGSGKTTFAKLLTRLMDPTAGTICIGGVDVRLVGFRSLRDRVVMVPQDGSLFRGTIDENVRMGKPDASTAEILATFDRLGLTDWLGELPGRLDTAVGERGTALSVGERQLVTLARAAIADPDILVLDEATSAVDPSTEARINRALAALTTGRTVVTIAHRMSTAETADRVLVFDAGRLAQDGTHSALLREGGRYGLLHASWQRGTRDIGAEAAQTAGSREV